MLNKEKKWIYKKKQWRSRIVEKEKKEDKLIVNYDLKRYKESLRIYC